VLSPANRVGEIGCSFATRVFDQGIRDFQEEILGNTADLLDNFWCIAGVVAFQNLQDAMWMLHALIMLNLAGMGMRQ
jgi:hypothetical protein